MGGAGGSVDGGRRPPSAPQVARVAPPPAAEGEAALTAEGARAVVAAWLYRARAVAAAAAEGVELGALPAEMVAAAEAEAEGEVERALAQAAALQRREAAERSDAFGEVVGLLLDAWAGAYAATLGTSATGWWEGAPEVRALLAAQAGEWARAVGYEQIKASFNDDEHASWAALSLPERELFEDAELHRQRLPEAEQPAWAALSLDACSNRLFDDALARYAALPLPFVQLQLELRRRLAAALDALPPRRAASAIAYLSARRRCARCARRQRAACRLLRGAADREERRVEAAEAAAAAESEAAAAEARAAEAKAAAPAAEAKAAEAAAAAQRAPAPAPPPPPLSPTRAHQPAPAGRICRRTPRRPTSRRRWPPLRARWRRPANARVAARAPAAAARARGLPSSNDRRQATPPPPKPRSTPRRPAVCHRRPPAARRAGAGAVAARDSFGTARTNPTAGGCRRSSASSTLTWRAAERAARAAVCEVGADGEDYAERGGEGLGGALCIGQRVLSAAIARSRRRTRA